MSDTETSAAGVLPRFLRLHSETDWHIRDARADSICQPLCNVRYDGSDDLIGADNPVRDPICVNCGLTYIREINDQPDLTAGIQVSIEFHKYLVNNPLYARHLEECQESWTAFEVLQSCTYSMIEFLLKDGSAAHLVTPLIQHVLNVHVPDDDDVRRQEQQAAERNKAMEELDELCARIKDDAAVIMAMQEQGVAAPVDPTQN